MDRLIWRRHGNVNRDLTRIGCEDTDCILSALVNTVITFRVPQKAGNFLKLHDCQLLKQGTVPWNFCLYTVYGKYGCVRSSGKGVEGSSVDQLRCCLNIYVEGLRKISKSSQFVQPLVRTSSESETSGVLEGLLTTTH
jgi:hypothetical protein